MRLTPVSVEVIRAGSLGGAARLPRPARRRFDGRCSPGSTSAPAAATTAKRSPRTAAARWRRCCPERELATVYQVHSPDVVARRAPWPHDERPHADAMVTDRPGLLLGILTADCAPVLFADARGRRGRRRPRRLARRVRRGDRRDGRGDGGARRPARADRRGGRPVHRAGSYEVDEAFARFLDADAGQRALLRRAPVASRTSTWKPMSRAACARPASARSRRSASTPMPTPSASSATAAPPIAASRLWAADQPDRPRANRPAEAFAG